MPADLTVIDSTMAEAVRRAGDWLACKPGCSQCCFGPFGISGEDASRLREGLGKVDATVASRVRGRARDWVAHWGAGLPPFEDEAFEDYANDVACPVLDPVTGTCDLYAWRPAQCRVFGPAVRVDDGVAVCELCFVGATPEQVDACAVELDWEAEAVTVVALALT